MKLFLVAVVPPLALFAVLLALGASRTSAAVIAGGLMSLSLNLYLRGDDA